MTQTLQGRRNPLSLRDAAAETLGRPDSVALTSGVVEGDPLLYNYELVPEEHRSVVMLSARRIKTKAERAKQDLLEIGRELHAVKQRLEHGQFSDWISWEFGMSLRSAQMLMNVWTVYGSKSETVSLLSDSALYLLSAPSVPEAARTDVELQAKATGKSPTKAEVKTAIALHRPHTPASGEQTPQEAGSKLNNQHQTGDGSAGGGEKLSAHSQTASSEAVVGSGLGVQALAKSDTAIRSDEGERPRVNELLALYRTVLSTLSEYGAITGRHTHTPAVRRALEPMIEELKQNRGRGGSLA